MPHEFRNFFPWDDPLPNVIFETEKQLLAILARLELLALKRCLQKVGFYPWDWFIVNDYLAFTPGLWQWASNDIVRSDLGMELKVFDDPRHIILSDFEFAEELRGHFG